MNTESASLYDLLRLDGRAGLITGADRGIGLAIARRFAEAGAELCIAGLDASGIKNAAENLRREYGVRVVPLAFDFADEESAGQLMQVALEAMPVLDILVNNAAVFPVTGFLEMSDSEWDRVMNINLRSPFILSRGFARNLVSRGAKGVVLNVASVSALTTAGNSAHYVASKHALAGLTKCMAVELGPLGIRCLALAPGMIMTPGAEEIMMETPENEAAFREYASTIPVGRPGEADEVAKVALFCVSEMASYLHGSVLPVDGGDMAR